MSLPLQLDPWTLRWLADSKEREHERLLVEAGDLDRRAAAGEPAWMAEAAARDRDRAGLFKREARWLRLAATRVERRRGRQ